MPFGGGPRNCLGTHFATTAMTIAAAALTRDYRITQSPGTSTAFDTRTILQPRGLTLDVAGRPDASGSP